MFYCECTFAGTVTLTIVFLSYSSMYGCNESCNATVDVFLFIWL